MLEWYEWALGIVQQDLPLGEEEDKIEEFRWQKWQQQHIIIENEHEDNTIDDNDREHNTIIQNDEDENIIIQDMIALLYRMMVSRRMIEGNGMILLLTIHKEQVK